MSAGIVLTVVGFMMIAAGVSRLLGGRDPHQRSRPSITLRSLLASRAGIIIATGVAMVAVGHSLMHPSHLALWTNLAQMQMHPSKTKPLVLGLSRSISWRFVLRRGPSRRHRMPGALIDCLRGEATATDPTQYGH